MVYKLMHRTAPTPFDAVDRASYGRYQFDCVKCFGRPMYPVVSFVEKGLPASGLQLNSNQLRRKWLCFPVPPFNWITWLNSTHTDSFALIASKLVTIIFRPYNSRTFECSLPCHRRHFLCMKHGRVFWKEKNNSLVKKKSFIEAIVWRRTQMFLLLPSIMIAHRNRCKPRSILVHPVVLHHLSTLMNILKTHLNAL